MALEITDQTIDSVLSEKAITMIDFWAEWCGPCRMLGPVIDEIAADNPDMTIGKLNVTDNAESTVKYGVRGIPCIVFFKDGEEVDRVTGVVPKTKLQAKLTELKN